MNFSVKILFKKSNLVFLSIILLLVISTPAISQNYNGGKNDGYAYLKSTDFSSFLVSKFNCGINDGYSSFVSQNFSSVLISKFAGGKNDGYSSELGVFQLIGEKPVVHIIQPIDGSLTADEIIAVSGTAEDDNIVSIVELKLNDGEWIEADNSELKLIDWSINISLSPGENTIQARAIDNHIQSSDILQLAIWYISPPENVVASEDVNKNHVEIFWNSSCGTHPLYTNYYKIFRSESDNPDHAVEISNWITDNFYFDETAQPAKNYWYFIKQKVNTTESYLSFGDKGFRGEILDIKIPLSQGWTWFSLNVYKENMSIENTLGSLTPRENDYIKNQTVSATYYNQDGWIGGLNEFNNTEMYKIKLDLPDLLEYTGFPVDVTGNPLIIKSGWNWIAYTPKYNLMLNDALLSLNINTFDYIKNQRFSSTYYEGYGWFGDLINLFPNDGYMIKLAEPGTLTYPPSEQSIAHKTPDEIVEINKEIPFYNIEFSRYEFTGSVTAEVFFNGYNSGSSENLLYAFAGNKCRGAAKGLLFPPTGNYVYNLMVFSNSNSGEELTFRFYYSEEEQWYEFEEKLMFEADMIEANAFNPFELKNGLALNSDWMNNNGFSFDVYPNPFNSFLNISFNNTKNQRINISIYDGYGRKVRIIDDKSYPPGTYNIDWNGNNLPNGVYYVRLQTDSFVSNQKVVKVN